MTHQLGAEITLPMESELGSITLKDLNSRPGKSIFLSFAKISIDGAEIYLRPATNDTLYIEKFGHYTFTTKIAFNSDFLFWVEEKVGGVRYSHWIENGYLQTETLDVGLPLHSQWIYPWSSVKGIVSQYIWT